MADDPVATAAVRAQTTDEVVRDLVSTYMGVIVRVDKYPDSAKVLLHRGGTTWSVLIERVANDG